MSEPADSTAPQSNSSDQKDGFEVGFALLSAMTNAVRDGDLDKATFMVQMGNKQGIMMTWCVNPVVWAICNEMVPFARRLIADGFDLSILDDQGACLLHPAARQGMTEVCRDLVARGLAVDSSNKVGDTPLMDACEYGHSCTARALVEMGANLNAQGFARNTPLHCAAFAGDAGLCVFLLSHGADWTVLNEDDLDASSAAALRISNTAHDAARAIDAFVASKEALRAIESMGSIAHEKFDWMNRKAPP